jgi:hypothetical protein
MASLEDESDERTVRMRFLLVMGFCKSKLDVEGLILRVLDPSFGRGETEERVQVFEKTDDSESW